MSRRLRTCALVVTASAAAACHSWQGRPVAPATPPALSGNSTVRITRTDRSTLVVDRARVEGDSIVGEVGRPPERVAVALRDVRQLDERRVSAARTGGLVIGGSMVVVLLLIAAAVAAALGSWN
jgi:hypothetical protein